MKLTFEAVNLKDLIFQMEAMLNGIRNKPETGLLRPEPEPFAEVKNEVKEVLQKIEQRLPADIANLVGNPVDKPGKRPRTPRQLENDERLRQRAAEKKAAGIKPFTKAPPKSDPLPPAPPPPATAESLGLAPDEVVNLRNKTITDLQEAYANGHQQEVFELLSRFGNGAKSFRELPPESFVPIREAIDNGALT